MKVSVQWLKDYVSISLAAKELAERLTMAGMEVKSLQTVGGAWEDVIVGEVIAVDPHPNADRLKLATVNVGARQITVVCGAPNIDPGQKVPFAHKGARILDGHSGQATTLKAVKIRGVLSEGMVLSEKELGISDSHEGIMVLPPETPVGTPLSSHLGDVILDLDITPNRPDCLSVIGVAREIAALTAGELRLPEAQYEETQSPIDSLITVEIAEPNLCPRYCASFVSGIQLGASPGWIQQRLASYGMRPINNVVDVTNYVMIEYGQPLHAFDYDKLRGKRIVVRRAQLGEAVTTIDGVERGLSSSTLVIADKERAVAIAGIMGGLDTEVTDETSSVLLESASFNRAVIRQGCCSLGLQSEASVRFDKGLSQELPLVALRRATKLLVELSGGRAASGTVDAYPGRTEPKVIPLSTEQLRRLSALALSTAEMTRVLESQGFSCRGTESSSEISVTAPYWRSDIKCTADLVEEVVRTIGYDKVPITRLSSSLPVQEPAPMLDFIAKLRAILVSCGFQEILTYSLTSLDKLQKLSERVQPKSALLKVVNPMTKEQEYLRTNLRAHVLATLAANQKREEGGIRLFEIGTVFLPRGRGLPREKEMLSAVLSGPRAELSWHGNREPLDFFDAKGVVESVFQQLGMEARFEASDDESLFPTRAADVDVVGNKMGIVGEVHPKVARNFEVSGPVCLIEIDVETLFDKTSGSRRYQSVARFPAVIRDIALVIDENVAFGRVENVIRSLPLVRKAVLFDIYRGEQIPEVKKSFAIRLVYQSPTHTLTDDEVDGVQEQMLRGLREQLGATLRT